MNEIRKMIIAATLGVFVVWALVLVAPATAGMNSTARDAVVIELFTSQGCSSCPPADRFLGELAARTDVIPLSFHVDYWNYLGWKDPFSTRESTDRQRAYRRVLGLRYVYTPQMVIGGTRQSVGSNRGDVMRAIERIRKEPRVPIRIEHPSADKAIVTIDAVADGGSTPSSPAVVWLFAYDSEQRTSIRRGENSGVEMINSNVVRVHRRIGKWSGGKLTISLPISMMGIENQAACAIIVQSEKTGRIWAAAKFQLPKKPS
jgi:hypothetical protein